MRAAPPPGAGAPTSPGHDGPGPGHAPRAGASTGGKGDRAPERLLRLTAFEEVAPPVAFSLVTVSIGADFVTDLLNGESDLHLVGMAIGMVLSMSGLATMLRVLARSRAKARELATALHDTSADSLRWREQAAEMLHGLGALIDRQFGAWGLSPSEREVGMLLLKGLSLREVAAVRGASEPTVRQQAQAIYRKAELAGRAELSAFFLEDLLLPHRESARTPPPAAGASGGQA